MIRRTVSAAFLLRDGFTGAVLTNGTATRCLLDGRPLARPIWKRDGYLVLTDLAPGDHELRICRSGYLDEPVPLHVDPDAPLEDTISLKPAAGYRIPPETARVTLTLRREKEPAALARVWLGLQPRTRLSLAQEKAARGETQARLFCEGRPALLPIPGYFLLADRASPELAYLRSLREETGAFALPLSTEHPRGTELIPMQPYAADGAGTVRALLRAPGTLALFCDGQMLTAPLQSGEQALEWELGG